jgi:hypothetical protein
VSWVSLYISRDVGDSVALDDFSENCSVRCRRSDGESEFLENFEIGIYRANLSQL